MKTLNSIPTNKIERATKLVGTGVKLGGNYLRYYGEKFIFGQKDRKIEIDRKGVHQEGWSADDLPFYVKNYICYDRKTDKRWNFDKIREHKFWKTN